MVVRENIKNPYDMTARGETYMKRVFGEADMNRFLKTMDNYFPDLRTFIAPHPLLDAYDQFDEIRTDAAICANREVNRELLLRHVSVRAIGAPRPRHVAAVPCLPSDYGRA